MLRSGSRRVTWGVLAVVGACLLLVASGGERSRAGTPETASSSRPSVLSCKPMPPVVVTLSAGAAPGSWSVRLDAKEPVSNATLAMGARGPEGEMTSKLVWHGALQQGEQRDLAVQWTPPPGATAVWAQAGSSNGSGTLLQARAAMAVVDGKPVAQLAAEPDGGRLVVDPTSGEKIAEYPGVTGGAR